MCINFNVKFFYIYKNTKINSAHRSSLVVLETSPENSNLTANGGRCVLSADQAVQFCGFAEEG